MANHGGRSGFGRIGCRGRGEQRGLALKAESSLASGTWRVQSFRQCWLVPEVLSEGGLMIELFTYSAPIAIPVKDGTSVSDNTFLAEFLDGRYGLVTM